MNDALNSFDDLLNAAMDDLDDLPPVGVPPSGHYTLKVSAERKTADSGNDYVALNYTVVEVGAVDNPAEETEAAVGMSFSSMFSPFKQDGTKNTFGIGLLKREIAPYSEHFGTKGVGQTIEAINEVVIAASLRRVSRKNDPDRADARLKDVVIL